MVWDFLETNPFNDVGANWIAGSEAFNSTIECESVIENIGHVECTSATKQILPTLDILFSLTLHITIQFNMQVYLIFSMSV